MSTADSPDRDETIIVAEHLCRTFPGPVVALDDLSVRQSDNAGGGAIVSVGKQLSRNWYVGYERGLNATTGNWQLIYRIAHRFTVRAQSGEQNSIELIWSWRWN